MCTKEWTQARLKMYLQITLKSCIFNIYVGYYLPTPPLGQDMTQGQFLSGV